ncbi:hypothetical protein BDF19DRAFT_410365 [Syncephalis fuscata]|nr:hypothetical protein BDF19DRAFT_410365 [Syncephalis fuscata]
MTSSAGLSSIAALRAQVLETTGVEEKVEVNQRHLIDKILARYSAKYTVFRELLQNANDAGAQCVEIHFEGVEKSGLFGKEHCNRVQVRNNGRVFATEDWHRLKKIAEGNPDEQKIGFFGVGFYSLFSICEGPFVTSGNECMAFLWKGDQLFAKRATISNDDNNQSTTNKQKEREWTTFLLDMRDPLEIPNKEEFGRFLASSISFTAHLLQLKVIIDGKVTISLEKQMGIPRPISLRELPGLQVKSPQKMFTLTEVDVQQVHLQSTVNSGSNDAGKVVSVFARVARAHLQVKVSKQQIHDMERTTKKKPPATTAVQMIYSGYEEHGASALDKKSIFADLMPFPKQGQIYIGFPTHQTTGFSSHVAAHFIPTVERESIDFVDPCLAAWNEDVLSMCGLLARILYEDELNTIANLYQELVGNPSQLIDDNKGRNDQENEAKQAAQTFLQERASHAIQAFTYKLSTPNASVGELGAYHFFGSTGTRAPRILSSHGVMPAQSVKRLNPALSSFVQTVPVIPTSIADTCKEFLEKLELLGFLNSVDARDVLEELNRRRLSAKEITALMAWWIRERQGFSVDYQRALLNRAVMPSGRPFTDPFYFLNPNVIPPTMPLPDQVIDYEITKTFKKRELEHYFGPWTELSLLTWIEFVVNQRPELETDTTFTESILSTLSRAWTSQPLAVQQRITQLLQSKKCVPTQRGHVVPTDAYFKQVTLFPDLPLIATSKGISEAFLASIGVRKHVDLQMVFSRQRDLNWDHVQLVKFLASIQSTLAERGGLKEDGTPLPPSRYYCAHELYLPQDNLRQLGLPIIQWNTNKFRAYTDEGKLLIFLGLNSYPPLDELLKIAATDDMNKQKLALNFLTGNFNSYYRDAYQPTKIKTAFLPCANGVNIRACPQDCFTDPSCAIMGFNVLMPEWRSHADKLGIRSFPTSEQLLNRLREQPPKTDKEAQVLFEFLATQQSEFKPIQLKALTALPFVPIVELASDVKEGEKSTKIRFVTPASCYFSSGEQSQHGGFFDYVDYGPVANSFLRSCGVRDEPSPKDLAEMLARSPQAFLNACNGYEAYLNVLRQLALNCDKLLSDRHLIGKLRTSAFLLGRENQQQQQQQQQQSTANDTKEKSADNKLEEILVTTSDTGHQLQYELARASDIYLIDDTVLQQIFSPLSAPMEALLERFYEILGSSWLSKRVKETFIRKGTPNRTPIAVQLEALIKERAALLFYDYQQGGDGSRILHDSQWLKRKLVVFEVPAIAIQLEFLPTKTIKTQPTSACVDASGGACRLYMTRVDFDHFDAANALGKVLFSKCRLNDALLLSTLLSSSMENLRRKGFPVDRILDIPKPTPKAAPNVASLPSGSNQSTEAANYIKQLKSMFPTCDIDFMREQLAKESDRHVERVANKLANMEYPEEKPQVISENDANEAPKSVTSPTPDDRKRSASHQSNDSLSGGSGLLGRLSRQLLGWQAPPPEPAKQPLLSESTPTPPPKHEVAPVDPNSTQRLQRALQSAIASCQPYQSDTLQSEGQIRQISESTVSYCDTIPSQRLQYVARLDKAVVFEDARLMRSLNRFTIVLLLLCDVFQLDRKTVHIFYDKDGATIAFNQSPAHALFFNLRFYDGLHFTDKETTIATAAIKEKFETYIYWFMTFCHELAHNFCREHSSQHEYYLSSFSEQYFGALSVRLSQEGVMPIGEDAN